MPGEVCLKRSALRGLPEETDYNAKMTFIIKYPDTIKLATYNPAVKVSGFSLFIFIHFSSVLYVFSFLFVDLFSS